jgi:hypothetical protein
MPNIETKPEPLPAASRDAVGCLFLPGCSGACIASVLGLAISCHALALIWALMAGEPLPAFPIENTSREWVKTVWSLLSFIAWQSIRGGRRQAWVYWLTLLCISGWIGLAWTSNSLHLHLGPLTKTPEQTARSGQWFVVIVISFVFLRFALGRKNRIYYGIVRPSP